MTLTGSLHNPVASDTTLFRCKRLFAGAGVIFQKDESRLILSATEHSRSITESEAEQADSIMLATSGSRNFEENKRQYYRYDRQYLGYQNEAGQQMVFINLVDKSKAKRVLSHYQQALTANILLVFTEPGAEFLARMKVDVHQGKAIDY